MKKEPLEIQASFFEDVWNKGNIDAIFKYFDGTATGLGIADEIDPVAYLDFFNAFQAAMKDIRIELLDGNQFGDRISVRVLISARAKRRDRAVILECAGWARYHQEKIVEAENFIDFVDLFRQLGVVPEEAVELGLAGEEILQLKPSETPLEESAKRLIWPGFSDAAILNRFSPAPLPGDNQLEVLFNSANFGMLTASERGDRVLDVNDSAELLFGRNRKELLGTPFSNLLTGKGKVAERNALNAVCRGERKHYRLPLNLSTIDGPLRVWVCAVKVPHRNGGKILRSLQRPELLDDLVAFQARERNSLVERIDDQVLEPVLTLWNQLTEPNVLDLGLKRHSTRVIRKLVENIRAQLAELRNPILEGKSLTSTLSYYKDIDPSVDTVGRPTALVTYRILEEARTRFGARPEDASLLVENNWLRGKVHVRKELKDTEFAACSDRCRLLGGHLALSTYAPAALTFEIPV